MQCFPYVHKCLQSDVQTIAKRKRTAQSGPFVNDAVQARMLPSCTEAACGSPPTGWDCMPDTNTPSTGVP